MYFCREAGGAELGGGGTFPATGLLMAPAEALKLLGRMQVFLCKGAKAEALLEKESILKGLTP